MPTHPSAAVPLPRLAHPIVLAPLGGGPSTPALAAAVSNAGGLGFLAAGYQTPQALAEQLAALRALTAAPVGVNVFVPGPDQADAGALARYRERLAGEAERWQVRLGTPRWDDDHYAAKLALLVDDPVAVVSFTFGLPGADDVAALRGAGSAVLVTVTTPEEAAAAAARGVDGLVVQGGEAGGHRGGWLDADAGAGADYGLLALLRLVRGEVDLPLVATGGIVDGAGVAAVLAAGAVAAQLGTAFLRCPEAATSAPHRRALEGRERTVVTRAFTGRRARGIRNRFIEAHDDAAPAGYPNVHHLTSPLRAAARQADDAGLLNLWAGQTYPLTEELPAAELVRRLSADAAAALEQARHSL